MKYLVTSLVALLASCSSSFATVDPNGYIVFCPCMGRFGNQADQYLGSLSFAKAINRTIILPPWVEYPPGEMGSIQVPFETYFKIEAIQKFHRAISFEKFMETLADKVWPQSNRISFCYRSRSDNNDCEPKKGNPFGPFWNRFNIDFVASETFGPLHYDTHNDPQLIERWNTKYPSSKYPVLAFTGAPGTFPVQKHNLHIQEYFEFADDLALVAKEFISDMKEKHKGPFVGVHLRNGGDWKKACELVKAAPLLFSGPQCFGYQGELLEPSLEERKLMCFPRTQDVLEQVAATVKEIGATWIFVGADHDHLLLEIEYHLRRTDVKVVRYPRNEPIIDLAVLSLSNHFIGNCFSSFSAFVKRQRDVYGLQSSFWRPSTRSDDRDEL